MIYCVKFEDNEEYANMRKMHMSAHLEFLRKNRDLIQAAGPLVDSSDNSPAGGLWLVHADSPQTVRSLVEIDPFWPTGLRKSVHILEWRQVFQA